MKHLAGQYFLNSDLRKEELISQAEMLCRAGYEIVYLHSRAGLKTPYLSRHWFEALKTVTDVLKRHHVQFAIWDEDNYPSGVAGNRIVNRYPELRASFLNFVQFEVEAGRVCRKLLTPEGDLLRCFFVDGKGTLIDITDECGTLQDEWAPAFIKTVAYSPHSQVPVPHRRRSMCGIRRFAVEFTPASNGRIIAVEILRSRGGHNSDLLNPETTKEFIGFTFERYSQEWGPENLAKECFGSFLDEPAPDGQFPWTKALPEQFKQEHGYDLVPKLPHLLLNLDENSERIRYDYRETLRNMLSENYLRLLKNDLNRRGILSTGHLTRSEWLSLANHKWPNEMRLFQELDIPCCDPLGPAIGKRGASAYHIGIKSVSSAARLFHKAAAGADCFAVGGEAISLKDLKFMLDYHLVLGITWYNVHGLYYTLEEERRDEAPPSLFYQHSQWPHANEFCRYLRQRCEELSGEHLCSIALLYPSSALESRIPGAPEEDSLLHETAEKLLSHQQDFELIDEITLAEQEPVAFARLRPFFIVAYAEVVTNETAVFLQRYAEAGGKVLPYGKIPRILGTSQKIVFGVVDDLLSVLPGSPLSGEGVEDIFIRKIQKSGQEKVYFFNRADSEFRGSWHGENVIIPPCGAGFLEELSPLEELPRIVPENWTMSCEKNCVPLRFWVYAGGNIDLFVPRNEPPRSFIEADRFCCVFFAEEGVKLALVSEEASLAAGSYVLNGKPVVGWKHAQFRDCREREAALDGLAVPGRNVLEFCGRLPENAPYLTGAFAVDFGNNEKLKLKRWDMQVCYRGHLDLREAGMATFSGTVLCKADFHVAQAGRYALYLQELHDSGKLTIDGREWGIRITSPAQWTVELQSGKHSLVLELCNGPGNRDIMSDTKAGMTILG